MLLSQIFDQTPADRHAFMQEQGEPTHRATTTQESRDMNATNTRPPIDLSHSKISGYDLAVLRSTYQAFGTRDCEWGEGAQAGMRAAAAILGITIDKEDDQ